MMNRYWQPSRISTSELQGTEWYENDYGNTFFVEYVEAVKK